MLRQSLTLILATFGAIASLNSIAIPVNAHGISTGYISGAIQFPQDRASQVRHTIRFTLPNTDITQIKIAVPEGIKIGNNITLFDDSKGEYLSAVIKINSDRNIEINLPKSLLINTKITLDLNSVSLWGTNRTYQIYAKISSSSKYKYM